MITYHLLLYLHAIVDGLKDRQLGFLLLNLLGNFLHLLNVMALHQTLCNVSATPHLSMQVE